LTRHEARQYALQALYQIEVGKADAFPAITHVLEDAVITDADLGFVRTLVEGTQEHSIEIDEILMGYIENWTIDRIAKVDLIVLRLAAYELLYAHDVDIATVLDEAVELAKEFSTDASGKFVNGVLAKVLPKVKEVRDRSKGEFGNEHRG
jgi:transcription antitermination protein NusB